MVAAANKWAAGLDKGDAEYEHARLEALWLHQYHNVANADLLKELVAHLSANRTQGVPNMIALVKEHAARLAAG